MSTRPVALITGASTGIGKATAEELGRDYHLILIARGEEKLQEIAEKLPSAEYHSCDLRNPQELQTIADKIETLDVLINNAGIEALGPICQSTWEDWQSAFELNVFAAATLTAKLLPQLRVRHGKVVMINSGAGRFTVPNAGIYCASKHALDALTKTLRAEEREIKVISIFPGRVDTPLQERIFEASGKEYHSEEHLKPSSVAQAIRFALENEDGCTEEIVLRPRSLQDR
ncbi:SDR family oxidoreductase [Actinomycetaceae bacterium TAE3-ERU4]|nr:SDR family oxidoreductase [Actinomycetaceae bacterium TAE3-ERU4]